MTFAGVGAVYCDLSGFGGMAWTLLMRVDADTSYGYPASVWTTEGGHSTTNLAPDSATSDAKFAAFDKLKVHQLRVENTQDKVHTILGLGKTEAGKSLLDIFKSADEAALTVLSGQADPVAVVNGGACAGWSSCPCTEGQCDCGNYCGADKLPWRLNAGPDSRFKVRIGGTFSYTW